MTVGKQQQFSNPTPKHSTEALPEAVYCNTISMMKSVVSMLPGMSHIRESDLDTRAVVRIMAIIDSMTPGERRRPQILSGSRKKRVARGSGQSVQEINRLLKQFAQIKRMMKSMQAMAGKGKKPRLPFFGR